MTDNPIPPSGQGSYPYWWNPGYVPSIQEWQNLWSQKIDYNRAETVIAEKIEEAGLIPIAGGIAKGPIYVDGNFVDKNGYTLSQPNGNAIGSNQFYTQLAQDKSGCLYGRLVMKNHDSSSHVLECTPDGSLKNINGQSLALIDDVAAETKRAQAAEADTVRTETRSNENPVDLLVFNNQEGTLAVHDSLAGRWHSCYTTESSIFAASSETDAKITRLRTAKKENNGRYALVADHEGYDSIWYASEDYVNKQINDGSLIKINNPDGHTRSRLYVLSYKAAGLHTNFNGRVPFPREIQGAGIDSSELVNNPNNVQIQITPVVNGGNLGIFVANKTINNKMVPDVTNSGFKLGMGFWGDPIPMDLYVTVYYWGD